MDKNKKIFVAGHGGMVGSAVVRELKRQGFQNILTASRDELNLMSQRMVEGFFANEKPDYVVLAAAKVGGIKANMEYPADFIYENLQVQNNVIHSSYKYGVEKLCCLGSSCIYPRQCPQPIKEEYFLTGPLEPTNEAYAVAKIAGIKMVEYYNKQYGFNGINVMPSNLYGTNDSFDLNNAHVLSSLVRKFVDGADNGDSSVPVWGTGTAMREFLHVDDAARAIVYLMETYDSPDIVNVGSGKDISIKGLAELIGEKAGFKGEVSWDRTKPDGMPRKCMDTSKLTSLGFTPTITLEEGIEQTIKEYRELKKISTIN